MTIEQFIYRAQLSFSIGLSLVNLRMSSRSMLSYLLAAVNVLHVQVKWNNALGTTRGVEKEASAEVLQ